MTGGFGLTLPTASSTGLASATFSTLGAASLFLAVLRPAVIFDNWSAETISTGSDSSTCSSARDEKDTRP